MLIVIIYNHLLYFTIINLRSFFKMKISNKILIFTLFTIFLFIVLLFVFFKKIVIDHNKNAFIENKTLIIQSVEELLSTSDLNISSEVSIEQNLAFQSFNQLLKKIKIKDTNQIALYSVIYDNNKNTMIYGPHSDIHDFDTFIIDIGINRLEIYKNTQENKIYIYHNHQLYSKDFYIKDDEHQYLISINQVTSEVLFNQKSILIFQTNSSALASCDLTLKSILHEENQSLNTKCNINNVFYPISYKFFKTGLSEIFIGSIFNQDPNLLNILKNQVIDKNQIYIQYEKLEHTKNLINSDLIKIFVPLKNKNNKTIGFLCLESVYNQIDILMNIIQMYLLHIFIFLLISLFIFRYFINFYIKKPIKKMLEAIQNIQKGDFTARIIQEKHDDEFSLLSKELNKTFEYIQHEMINFNTTVTQKTYELSTTINALENRKHNIDQIIEHSPTGIIISNHKQIIQSVNSASTKIFNYSEQELLNQNLNLIMPTITKTDCEVCQYKICHSQYNVCQFSIKTRFEQEKIILINRSQILDDSGHYLTVHIINDLTELKNKERQFVELVNAIFESILIHKDGKILFVNQTFFDFTGFSNQEVINQYIYDFVIPEEINGLKSHLNQLTLENNQSEQLNSLRLNILTKDQTIMPVEATARNYIYANQKVRLVTIRDLTKSIEYENSLILAKENAEQANRAKNDFVAYTIHEIRSPLGSIICGLEFLEEEKFDPILVADYLLKIKQSAFRLLEFSNDLLDISKIESGQMTFEFESSNILNIINECLKESEIQFNEKQLKNHIHFDIQQVFYLENIECDKFRIGQVFRNLISNALKYAPQKSQIDINLNIDLQHQYLTASVRDQGVGIAHGEEMLIFKRYEQGKNTQAGGTGLGLSICNKIIDAHHGNIKAYNHKLGGMVIEFQIPIKQSQN